MRDVLAAAKRGPLQPGGSQASKEARNPTGWFDALFRFSCPFATVTSNFAEVACVHEPSRTLVEVCITRMTD